MRIRWKTTSIIGLCTFLCVWFCLLSLHGRFQKRSIAPALRTVQIDRRNKTLEGSQKQDDSVFPSSTAEYNGLAARVNSHERRELPAKKVDSGEHTVCSARILGQHPWTGTCGSKPVRFAGGRKVDVKCVRFGTEYGGFQMPDPMCFLKPGDVIYGFGVGEDISYDVAFASNYDVTVRIFDPTPRASEHVEAVLNTIRSGQRPESAPSGKADCYLFNGQEREVSGKYPADKYFANVLESGLSEKRLTYRPWALGVEDGTMEFHSPKGGKGVSHTLNAAADGSSIRVPVRSLGSIMAEFGDTAISVLKIDIEGFEVKVIPQLVELWKKIPKEGWPRVLAFDMDSLREGHPQKDAEGAKAAIMQLKALGYTQFSLSGGADIVFVLDTMDPAQTKSVDDDGGGTNAVFADAFPLSSRPTLFRRVSL